MYVVGAARPCRTFRAQGPRPDGPCKIPLRPIVLVLRNGAEADPRTNLLNLRKAAHCTSLHHHNEVLQVGAQAKAVGALRVPSKDLEGVSKGDTIEYRPGNVYHQFPFALHVYHRNPDGSC